MATGDSFKYVNQFQEHLDNALEKVQGDHLNLIQEAVKFLQTDNVTTQSRVFLDSCLFTLNNNPYINYMFYMDFASQDDVFRSKSSNYSYNTDEGCVTATDTNYPGIVHSIMYSPKYGNHINEFILSADAVIPRGAGIKYSISKDLNNYYPIKESTTGVPTSLENIVFDKVYIKIELIANTAGDSPRLFSIALFCLDKAITANSLLVNPSLTPINTPTDISGDTILFYNDDGKLETVETSDGSIVTLHYDFNEGFLDNVKKVKGGRTTNTDLIRENGRLSIVRVGITDIPEEVV